MVEFFGESAGKKLWESRAALGLLAHFSGRVGGARKFTGTDSRRTRVPDGICHSTPARREISSALAGIPSVFPGDDSQCAEVDRSFGESALWTNLG